MSAPLPLNEEQRDCLQELCNIAMGAAGESLANFAQVFVNLSIPKIRYIEPDRISDSLASLRSDEGVSAAVQFFSMDDHGGYALVVITDSSFRDLAASAQRPLANEDDALALLHDLTSTINNTCLPCLAELMDAGVELAQPDVLGRGMALDDLQLSDIAGWDHLVSVEINYHLENQPFNCDLLLLLPDEVVDELADALESLLAD